MTQTGSGDPALASYYPAWLDRLADEVTLVTSDAAGQTQHVVGNYRPRSTLLVLSRLLGEKFAGTPTGEHFIAS